MGVASWAEHSGVRQVSVSHVHTRERGEGRAQVCAGDVETGS